MLILHRCPREAVASITARWNVVHKFMDAYGRAAARVPRVAPTPAELDRLQRTLDWLLWIDGDERLVVWCRAAKVKWCQVPALRKIAFRANAERD